MQNAPIFSLSYSAKIYFFIITSAPGARPQKGSQFVPEHHFLHSTRILCLKSIDFYDQIKRNIPVALKQSPFTSFAQIQGFFLNSTAKITFYGRVIEFNTRPDQGCQIFLGPTYQNGKNILNNHMIYQRPTKYTN
jgi:hypothetical protein